MIELQNLLVIILMIACVVIAIIASRIPKEIEVEPESYERKPHPIFDKIDELNEKYEGLYFHDARTARKWRFAMASHEQFGCWGRNKGCGFLVNITSYGHDYGRLELPLKDFEDLLNKGDYVPCALGINNDFTEVVL